MTFRATKRLAVRTTRVGVRMARAGVSASVREALPRPPELGEVPEGRIVELPGRGHTFVVDVPGPRPDAPTLVLLHGLGCTAYLGWAATIEALRADYRVVTFDQRWHGRGIRSPRFRIADCADDTAAVMDVLGIHQALVVGYSMGGAVAQETWHRHPERVAGLILCSTAATWRGHRGEELFYPLLTVAMHPLSAYALARVEMRAALLPESPLTDVSDPARWARDEFRSTSLWSLPEVIAEMGRYNSTAWLGEIDVPAAVVVTERDHTIPTRRQRELAEAIPGATVFVAPGGHASVFLDTARWLPAFRDAVDHVAATAHPARRLLAGAGG